MLMPIAQMTCRLKKGKERLKVRKSCKEQGNAGLRQIRRTIKKCVIMKIIPNMVQRHDDHYKPSEKIYRFNTVFGVHKDKNNQPGDSTAR
jgi:predicted sugar kinase